MKTSAFTRIVSWLSFGFAILIYCVAGLSGATSTEARTITLGLQFERLQYSTLDPNYQGSTYYTVNVSVSSDVAPVTEDDVYSPNTNAYSGSENGSGVSYFGGFATALDRATNGVWTLVVNQGDASQQIYTFTVSADGLGANPFPAVQITTPVDGNPAVSTNTSFVWSGPTAWDGVDVDVHNPDYSFYNGASFPASTTSWNAGTLPLDTNYFEVTYTTNAAAYITISTPVDNLSQPFTNWVSGSTLNDYAESGFVTSTNPVSLSGGHTLMAHYTFDDSGYLGEDSSSAGNSLDSESSWGPQETGSADAEAGGGAVQFFGTSSLTPNDQVLTNLDNVLAGSFTFSTWVKTTASQGNDGDDAVSGATIFWAYNDHDGTNDTIPLAITGSKAAFFTRDHAGNSTTLHSTSSVNDGNYHLLTVTRDQATGEEKIYVDGNLEASEFGTTDPLNGNNYYLSVGGTTISSYNGLLDDLQIYSGVLSASDIASLYANPGQSAADVIGDDFSTALNTTNLTWTTGGDVGWFTETTNTEDRIEAVQSGLITDNQSSWMETTAPSNGQISFYWKVSSEGGYDYLHFYINGNEQDAISGEVDWNQETYSVSAGDVLRWEYSKDQSSSDGLDAGFLDEVNFTPILTPVITLNPFSQTNYPGYNVALVAAATTGNTNDTIIWQWYNDSGAIAGATSAAYYPTNAGTANVAGNYYAVATTLAGSTTTGTGTVTFVSAPLPPDWSKAFKSPFAPVDDSTITRDYYYGCITDTNGNVYVAAEFGGNVTVGLLNLNSGANDSAAIVKQSPTGTPLWAAGLTNNGTGYSFAECVAPAPGGGVYLYGNYSGTNWLGTNQLVDAGNGDIFIARFDANGSNLWIKTFGGTNSDFATYNQLTADPAGDVTLSALFGSGPVTIGSSHYDIAGQQGALIQLDQNGAVLWSQVTPGWIQSLTYNSGCLYVSLNATVSSQTTNTDNMLVAGVTNIAIGGISNLTDRAWGIACLNGSSGQAIWVQAVGGPYGGSSGNPYSTGYLDDQPILAVAGTNVFVTGAAYGSGASFGSLTVNFGALRGQYFARYDTNGNALTANTYGSVTTSPRAIVANAQGNAYVSGIFDTYSFFGSNEIAAPVGIPSSVQSVGNSFSQSFLAKFDVNGNPLWARQAISGNEVTFFGIALAPDGVWASGWGLSAQYPQFQYLTFGTNYIFSDARYVSGGAGGSTSVIWYPSGVLAKITDGVAALTPTPVTILNPQINGTNFQFSFVSINGFTNAVQSRTNLISGSWQTYTNFTGDGTLKTVLIPRLAPPIQFFRVTTQ